MKSLLNLIFRLQYLFLSKLTVGQNTRLDYWHLKCHGGTVNIGDDCDIHCRVSFDRPFGRVKIGDRCYIGRSHLVCHTGIEIGNDVIISWGVTILDHNSHSLDWEHRQQDVLLWKKGEKDWDNVKVKPVKINDKAWIGYGATILKGVEIGEGAVIGACAVVTSNVPAYSVVAGNPAKIIRNFGQKLEN